MNYKSRIKSIEQKLNFQINGMDFKKLLDPDFVYRGKPFDNIDEMYRNFNIINIPSDLTYDEIIILLEKRIISVVSITAQRLIVETRKEMERCM